MPKRPAAESHVRSMSGVRSRPVEWLWPGWIPLGKLTVLDGDPGVGKSTLLIDLAARLSRDGVMPDGVLGPVGMSLCYLLAHIEGVAKRTLQRGAQAGPRPAAKGADGRRSALGNGSRNGGRVRRRKKS